VLPDLPYDTEKDLDPVLFIGTAPYVVSTQVQKPFQSLGDVIAAAKAKPAAVSYGSVGSGSVGHLAMALLSKQAGVQLVHVPYRGGGPALVDLMSGRVQLMFDNLPTSLEFIKAGKLRPLAVTTAQRSPVVPDLPTVADFVPGYEASAWYGLVAPKGTPAAIVDKLNTAVNAMLADPTARARFIDLGASLLPGSAADFGNLIADETEKWGKVIKFAGIKPE
jgi:tripartite-type tricarboxylate transporter receptor subunit TctC